MTLVVFRGSGRKWQSSSEGEMVTQGDMARCFLSPTVHFFLQFYHIFMLALILKFSCLIGSDPEHIFLTDGASKGVMQMLNAIIRGEGDGVNSFSFHIVSFCFLCFPIKHIQFSNLLQTLFKCYIFHPGSGASPTVPTLLCCNSSLWWFSCPILP